MHWQYYMIKQWQIKQYRENTANIEIELASENHIKVGEHEAIEVESFTYLIASVTLDGGDTADIKRRVALVNETFRGLPKIRRAGTLKEGQHSFSRIIVVSVLL